MGENNRVMAWGLLEAQCGEACVPRALDGGRDWGSFQRHWGVRSFRQQHYKLTQSVIPVYTV